MTLICGTCNIERASRTCALLTKEREELEQVKNTETNREWIVREIIEEHYA